MRPQDEFVAARKRDWDELEQLLALGKGFRKLPPISITRAASIYRAVSSDLMRAQEATARNWLDRGYPPVTPAEVPKVDNPFAEPENATVDPDATVKRPILM